MLKKSMKIVSMLMGIMVVISLTSSVFANQNLNWDISLKNVSATNLSNSVSSVMGNALYIMQIVGAGVAVIMLIVLAIKYISAAPGDKAEIKKHAVVYIVGAVVLFAATGILQIIKNFADTSLNS